MPALLQGLLQEIYPESVNKIQQIFAAWHLEVNAYILHNWVKAEENTSTSS